MPRPARVSPERILSAAAVEFSARGYAGARVDRIARRARVNKAMLYYHFGSKQALYRAVLRQTFDRAAERLGAVAAAPASPSLKVEQLVSAFAAFLDENEHLPAIMLREIAEGGTHLDLETLASLARLPAIVGGVVREGAARGELRPVHPFLAYFAMLAPLVFYLAGAPIRKALSAHKLMSIADLTPESFVRQFQELARLALVAPAHADLRS
jgi:TetR/AcrR family transcriptional regulator